MSQFRQRGKKLSPFTILGVMARARAGESVTALASEFAVNRATINRWLLKWGQEAELVGELERGRLALRATAQMMQAEQQAAG